MNWTDECVRVTIMPLNTGSYIIYANLQNVCNFCSSDHLQNVYKHGCCAVLQNTLSAFTLKVMSNGPL